MVASLSKWAATLSRCRAPLLRRPPGMHSTMRSGRLLDFMNEPKPMRRSTETLDGLAGEKAAIHNLADETAERIWPACQPGGSPGEAGLASALYLQANCAQCHVLAGGGNSLMDLEFTTPKRRPSLRRPSAASDVRHRQSVAHRAGRTGSLRAAPAAVAARAGPDAAVGYVGGG